MTRDVLLLIAAGSAVATATGLFLLRKRTGEDVIPSQPSFPGSDSPPKAYGEATRVTLAVPAGWRRVSGAEVSALPELGSRARSLMNASGFTSMTYGSLTPFVASDEREYATWIEQHYHEPGGAAKPWGLHHGVTILAQANAPSTLADEWSNVRWGST